LRKKIKFKLIQIVEGLVADEHQRSIRKRLQQTELELVEALDRGESVDISGFQQKLYSAEAYFLNTEEIEYKLEQKGGYRDRAIKTGIKNESQCLLEDIKNNVQVSAERYDYLQNRELLKKLSKYDDCTDLLNELKEVFPIYRCKFQVLFINQNLNSSDSPVVASNSEDKEYQQEIFTKYLNILDKNTDKYLKAHKEKKWEFKSTILPLDENDINEAERFGINVGDMKERLIDYNREVHEGFLKYYLYKSLILKEGHDDDDYLEGLRQESGQNDFQKYINKAKELGVNVEYYQGILNVLVTIRKNGVNIKPLIKGLLEYINATKIS